MILADLANPLLHTSGNHGSADLESKKYLR